MLHVTWGLSSQVKPNTKHMQHEMAVHIQWVPYPFLIFYLHFRIEIIAKNEASDWTKDCEVDIRLDLNGFVAACIKPYWIYLP